MPDASKWWCVWVPKERDVHRRRAIFDRPRSEWPMWTTSIEHDAINRALFLGGRAVRCDVLFAAWGRLVAGEVTLEAVGTVAQLSAVNDAAGLVEVRDG